MNSLREVDLMPDRSVMMMPPTVMYQISANDLDTLIAKAIEKGFERGQKKPVEKTLTREDAAAFLKIAPSTLDRKIKSGKLPRSLRHIVGGTILFIASELENFVKES